MTFFKKAFHFFIYSNLFIAGCAVLMVYQTCQLVLHTVPDLYFIAFVFFATICSYSFHWYLTPAGVETVTSRTQWLQKNKKIHLVLFIVGLAGAAVAVLFLWQYLHWLLLSAAVTFLYSAPKVPHPYFRVLRKIALAKTIFLAFVWMYVTTVLPLQISDQPWKPGFTLFSASRFFLIYAICILFDYRDREYDKAVGIRSLITWMNEAGINRLFIFSLVLHIILACWLIQYGYSSTVIAFLLVPGIITASLYRHAKKNFSDILYYFILDGLMALSPVLTLLLSGYLK
jgi:1,4-dihydroxy-2-naphthoate octaprenyltransferase